VPIYEYQCSKCGEIFEAFQKVTDNPLSQCKFCQGQVERLISHSSFQLKGSGWYLSDYARKSSSSDSPESKPADKSDGKPAEKTSSTTSKDSKND
jgi:putative FmdB family regulatory protein